MIFKNQQLLDGSKRKNEYSILFIKIINILKPGGRKYESAEYDDIKNNLLNGKN